MRRGSEESATAPRTITDSQAVVLRENVIPRLLQVSRSASCFVNQ